MSAHLIIDKTSNKTDLLRHDWGTEEVADLFALPMNDLLFRAHTVHRQYFDPNEIQLSALRIAARRRGEPGGIHPLSHARPASAFGIAIGGRRLGLGSSVRREPG